MGFKSRIKRDLIKLCSFGKPQKKILFDSFGGRQYSEDPRAISEKMHDMYPDYRIVWVINPEDREKNKVLLPDYVKVVGGQIGFIKELATSAAYITTEPLTEGFYKRRGQFVVQTWHGDRGMKKILYEASPHRNKIYDNAYTDVCIAASSFGEKRYCKAFNYGGEILSVGMPRNDKLVCFDERNYRAIRESFHIPETYKVLTYAPTFRGHSENEQNSEINIERVLSVLEKKGEKWICLLRAHEYSKGIRFDGSNEKVMDVSRYPDMSDVLLITDMLITDYSTCAGDFLVRKKPIILVINDEEEYKRSSRSLYFDLKETGYILSHSQDELEQIISTYSDEQYIVSCEKVLLFYATKECGHASEIICDRINQHYIGLLNKHHATTAL